MTGCTIGGHRIRTHDQVRDEIRDCLGSYGIRCKTEEMACFAEVDPGSHKRPDISILQGQVDARKTILDVMITNPVNARSRTIAREGGYAAQYGYNWKMRKYNVEAQLNNLKFVPMIIESTGYMHKAMIDLLKSISGMNDKHKDYDTIANYQYMMTNISVTLQKGMADAYLHGKVRAHTGSKLPLIARHYSHEAILDFADNVVYNGGHVDALCNTIGYSKLIKKCIKCVIY